METEKNFLFKPQDLYFRNKRKLPRKKMKTATFRFYLKWKNGISVWLNGHG